MGESKEVENDFRCALKHEDQFVLPAAETAISILADEHKPWKQADLFMYTSSYVGISVSYSPELLAGK